MTAVNFAFCHASKCQPIMTLKQNLVEIKLICSKAIKSRIGRWIDNTEIVLILLSIYDQDIFIRPFPLTRTGTQSLCVMYNKYT